MRLRYGALDFDAVPLGRSPSVAYVIQAPPVFFSDGPLQIGVSLMWPAGIAALVYAVRAAADAADRADRCARRGSGRHSGRR